MDFLHSLFDHGSSEQVVSSTMRQKKLIGLSKEVDLPDWLLSVESVASVGKNYE